MAAWNQHVLPAFSAVERPPADRLLRETEAERHLPPGFAGSAGYGPAALGGRPRMDERSQPAHRDRWRRDFAGNCGEISSGGSDTAEKRPACGRDGLAD